MAGFLSPSHVVLLLIVVLLVFGAKRLPEFGRSLGTGMREFKHSLDVDSRDEHPSLAAAPAPAAGRDSVPVPAPAAVAPPGNLALASVIHPDAVDGVDTRPAV